MILFWDTETTGFFDDRLPVDHEAQPYIVQLAAELCEDDGRAAGINKPKPPKLEECIRHFFGEELDGAHDAMVDVVACRRVFFHLRTLERAA